MLFKFKKVYSRENFVKSRKQKSLNPLLNRHRLKLRSIYLNRKVKVDLYLPADLSDFRFTLFLNDGQDAEQLRLVKSLTELFSKGGGIIKFAIVAIHANEQRMQEYGVAGNPDFKNRGNRAQKYSDFITKELVPFLQLEYGLMRKEQENVFAGFSMGGLSALDISWNHPELFKKIGVFSGSLWWRTLNTGTAKDDASRIMHRLIRDSEKREDLKFWFETGTRDEKSDRNKNGVIDSIDDTRDLIKELKALGYTDEDIAYEEIEGGQHNFHTWSSIFPEFLRWAFPGQQKNSAAV